MWASTRHDCLRLGEIEAYRPCGVAGVVERFRLDPQGGVVEATITDGNDSLTAQWVIRRPFQQFRATPGRGLILEGIAHVNLDGRLLMIEPNFEVVRKLRHQFLHGQTALVVKRHLLFEPGVVVASVPYHIEP